MSFKEIYGHKKQVHILAASVLRNRIPHGYLFYGMKGIGKSAVAKVFAKALNCEHQNTSRRENYSFQGGSDCFDSCDRCSSCLKTDRNNHPDIVTIKADGQFIRKQEIRDVQDQMKFAPLEGGMRIFIIVDADRMNSIAANALLKTLEEPSRSNLLILITSNPHKLPATILSRCQQVRFNPLHSETVASFLNARLSLPPERASIVASSSGGSIGKALKISDESYIAVRDEILRIISADPGKDPLKFLSLIHGFGQEREEMTDRINILLTGYRDALIYKETGDERHLINQDCADIIKSAALRLSGSDILNNIRTLYWAMSAIDLNANKQLTLEVMLFKLTRFCE